MQKTLATEEAQAALSTPESAGVNGDQLPSAVQTALFDLGQEVLGPLFTYFTRRLISRSRELDSDRLYFLARDGFLLQRLYERLTRRIPGASRKHSYLYISRPATALASVRRFGLREIRRLWVTHRKEVTAARALEIFGLRDDEILSMIRAAGFDPARWLEHPFYEPVVQWMFENREFQRAVAERAEAARSLLRRYLEQEGLYDCKAPALVDLGWNGTIQNSLDRAFEDDPAWPRPRGLYLCLTDDEWQQLDRSSNAPKEGLVADYRRPVRDAQSIFFFMELFEDATRAPHGTTTGYREEGGRVVPVLKTGQERFAEAAADAAIAEVQRGIFHHADQLDLSEDLGSLRERALRRLETFVFLPTSGELEAMRHIVHGDGWDGPNHRPLLDEPPPFWWLNPRDWMNRLTKAFWKPGYVTATGGRPLAHVYRMYVRARGRI